MITVRIQTLKCTCIRKATPPPHTHTLVRSLVDVTNGLSTNVIIQTARQTDVHDKNTPWSYFGAAFAMWLKTPSKKEK